MASHDSRSEYESRMHRVLAYIDEHLDEQLDLTTLAEVAHFSSFHFHRLFSAWIGETFGDYLRRRRIEVAAMRLAACGLRLAACGSASHENLEHRLVSGFWLCGSIYPRVQMPLWMLAYSLARTAVLTTPCKQQFWSGE